MDPARYTVREFRDADYDGLARIETRLYPDRPVSADVYRHFMRLAEGPGRTPFRLTVEPAGGGDLVATGFLEQMPFNYHPRKHWAWITVDRDHQRRGIGDELAGRLESEARRREAILFWSQVRADDDAAIRFFHRHGFVEKGRMRQSELSVTPEAVRILPDRTEPLRAMGIECTTLAAEGADRDEVRHRYHRLHTVSAQGMPSMGERTPLSFEDFVRLEFGGPAFDPDATFLAKAGDIYVGVTMLEKELTRPRTFHVGYTGTDPDFRGRGVASELKRRALVYALAQGYATIETTNDYANPRIWAINEKVGFRTVRSYLNGEKTLAPSG